MRVDKNILISDIKLAFLKQFEGLKLEFFKVSHEVSEASSMKEMLKEDVLLGKLNSEVGESELLWNATMTVAQVEQYFEEHLGVHVQVFCKLGTIWIETSTTDDYTLDRQMNRSKESLKAIGK
jgi:hypothetical protein